MGEGSPYPPAPPGRGVAGTWLSHQHPLWQAPQMQMVLLCLKWFPLLCNKLS